MSANPKSMEEIDTRNKVEEIERGKTTDKNNGDPRKEGDPSMEEGDPGKEEGDLGKEEGDLGKEEGDPHKEEGVDVLINPDYDVSPFWVIKLDGLINCSAGLFVKDPGLVQALEEWSDDVNANYIPEDPGAMRPRSFREKLLLEFQGIFLAHRIQEDLNSSSPKYTVQFHSSLLCRRSSDFSTLIEQMATLVDEIQFVEDEGEHTSLSGVLAEHLNVCMESALASSSSSSPSQFWANLDFAGPKGWTILEFIANPHKRAL